MLFRSSESIPLEFYSPSVGVLDTGISVHV